MEVPQVANAPGCGGIALSEPGPPEAGKATGAPDLFAMLIAHLLQMAEAAAEGNAETGQPVDVDSALPVPEQAMGDGTVRGETMPEEALEGLGALLAAAPIRSSATYRALPTQNQPVPEGKVLAATLVVELDPDAVVALDPDAVVAEELESLVDPARLESASVPKFMKLFETMMRAAASRAAMNVTPEGRVGEVIPTATGPPAGHVKVATLETVATAPAASGLTVETDLDVVRVVSERVVPEPARSTLDDLGRMTLKSVRYLVSRGESTMKVRLEPPSLGEVRFEVTSAGRALSIRLASANPAVREALEGHLGGLRESLVRDGHQVVEISVSADAASGHSAPHEHRRSATFDGAPQTPTSEPREHDLSADPGDLNQERTPTHIGTLNLFI